MDYGVITTAKSQAEGRLKVEAGRGSRDKKKAILKRTVAKHKKRDGTGGPGLNPMMGGMMPGVPATPTIGSLPSSAGSSGFSQFLPPYAMPSSAIPSSSIAPDSSQAPAAAPPANLPRPAGIPPSLPSTLSPFGSPPATAKSHRSIGAKGLGIKGIKRVRLKSLVSASKGLRKGLRKGTTLSGLKLGKHKGLVL